MLCADESKTHETGYYVVPQRNLLIFNKYVEANGVTLAKPDEAIIRAALCGSDIVHVMFPFVLGITTAQIAKEMNLPVTAGFHMLAENVTVHLHLENHEFASRLIYSHFYKLYKNCDAVHFPTHYLKETYEKIFGQVNGYVISNGVNDIFKRKSLASANDGYIRILSVGRYSKEKAQSILIDAVKLSVHKQKIQLIFAGDGPLKKELKKRSDCLPVSSVFAFYLRQELVDVINLYPKDCADEENKILSLFLGLFLRGKQILCLYQGLSFSFFCSASYLIRQALLLLHCRNLS